MKYLILVAALIVTACTTPYQEMGALGGVTATPISNNEAQIVAAVNGYTDRSVAEQYALLKAAEYTIEKGFGYFAIVSEVSDTNRQTSFSYNYYTGFQSYTTEKPRTDFRIRMYSGKAPRNAPTNVYDAQEVVDTLGSLVLRPETA